MTTTDTTINETELRLSIAACFRFGYPLLSKDVRADISEREVFDSVMRQFEHPAAVGVSYFWHTGQVGAHEPGDWQVTFQRDGDFSVEPIENLSDELVDIYLHG